MATFGTILLTIIFAIIGYIFGNFPTGELIGKIFNRDIRHVGSGNIGATNVSRELGLKLGLLVLAIDALKAYLAVIICLGIYCWSINRWFFMDSAKNTYAIASVFYLGGLMAIIGHCYPIRYLIRLIKKDSTANEVKGGKGVSSTFGFICSISIFLALIFVVVWCLVVYFTNYVSVASIISVWISLVLVFVPYINMLYLMQVHLWWNNIDHGAFHWDWPLIGIIAFYLLNAAIIVTIRHRDNIGRLSTGNENKIHG